jgi:hypothetical protein
VLVIDALTNLLDLAIASASINLASAIPLDLAIAALASHFALASTLAASACTALSSFSFCIAFCVASILALILSSTSNGNVISSTKYTLFTFIPFSSKSDLRFSNTFILNSSFLGQYNLSTSY